MGTTASAAAPEELINTLTAVAREGSGNAQAKAALRQLTASDVKVLPIILRAFDDNNPLAANWLRSAVETIVDREIKAGRQLPIAELEKFLLDRRGNARARRLTFECLVKVDETAADRLIPGMLDDPSADLRREAVGRLITEASKLDTEKKSNESIAVFQQALTGAVDSDQVKAIVGPLRKLGQKVDLQKHFGFLTSWHAIGPFDNRERKGFAVSYPPEKNVDLKATTKGQLGDVGWVPLSTKHDYGIVDIAKTIKPYKGAAMYLTTPFSSNKSQTGEIRLGTPNAWKLWVNGKLLFAREEYHRGMAIDQYRVPVVLKSGRNTLLLKICQNEQTQSWAQRYQFQLRVCNPQGSAILSESGNVAVQNLPTPSLVARKVKP